MSHSVTGHLGRVRPSRGGKGILLYLMVLPFLVMPISISTAGDEAPITDRVTIKSKVDAGVVIDGRKYVVTRSTSIRDVSGKEITLCDLRVPSEAVVKYRIGEDGVPVCLSIENRRLLEGATSLVIADDPG